MEKVYLVIDLERSPKDCVVDVCSTLMLALQAKSDYLSCMAYPSEDIIIQESTFTK